MSIRALRVRDAADLRKKLGGGPSILLSVSVPYQRTIPPDVEPASRKLIEARNRAYLDAAEPVNIRSAVISLTRTMLLRGVRLVFGAHPSVSPMVLDTARDVALYRDEQIAESDVSAPMRSVSPAEAAKARVLIFQSAYFQRELPQSTLQLASWDAGVLVLTPAIAAKAKQPTAARNASLTLMRELMISVPDIRAAIFIGGMEGVEEEAQLFRQRVARTPMYAIASTGSAARKLWDQEPSAYSGALASPNMLRDNLSYTVLASDILSDLGIRGEHR